MNKVVTDQLKQVTEIARKTLKTSERVEKVQDQDREDYHTLIDRVGHMEVEVKGLKEAIKTIPKETQEIVNATVAPLIKQINDLTDMIESKKVLPLPPKKKSWWSKIRGR
jgi:nucleoside-triphosphatase THEP1